MDILGTIKNGGEPAHYMGYLVLQSDNDKVFDVIDGHREGQHEHEMKALEIRWEEMVGRLGSESFPDFLRCHWNSRHSFVRQTELFKTIRSKINTRDAVSDLIRHMEEDMDTYMALTQPDTSSWTPRQKTYARELRMFSVRQPFSLLMSAHQRTGAGV